MYAGRSPRAGPTYSNRRGDQRSARWLVPRRRNTAGPDASFLDDSNPLSGVACTCRSVLDDPAIGQIDDAVAVGRVRFRMRHLNDGGALLVQTLEKLHDLLALGGVQVPGGLVGED